MPTTSGGYALPYPPATGVLPDVPYNLQVLAEALEAHLLNLGKQASGQTSHAVANLAAGAAVTVNITFPTGRFTVAPDVVATLTGASGGTNYLVARSANITATGCSIVLYNLGTTAIGSGVGAQVVKWMAQGA